MIKTIHTDAAPQAIGPYSQAVVANGFIFCSGQVGRVPGTKTIADDVKTQTYQVLKNLSEVLKAAGSDINHVVKTTIFLVNMKDFFQVNEVYGLYFKNHYPARATVEVSKLPQGDLPIPPLIEVEAVALVP